MKEFLIQYKIVVYLFLVGLFTYLGYEMILLFENQTPNLPVYGENRKSSEGEMIYHRIPSFEFIDQSNNNFSDKEIEGKIWVANYFFTSCPSICPKMSYNLQSVQDLYRGDRQVTILSFTVDPKRDTPARLRQYAERYNADHGQWHFLTGDKKALYWLARKGFYISATEGPGDELDFIHSENIVLIDQEKRIRGYYDGTDKKAVDQLIKDIAKLKKRKS